VTVWSRSREDWNDGIVEWWNDGEDRRDTGSEVVLVLDLRLFENPVPYPVLSLEGRGQR
jgi:hypothetical protein